MKLFIFAIGLGLIGVSVAILKPLIRNLPEFGWWEFLVGSFALSLFGSGLRMILFLLF
ncbi:MAG: hypothetical protein NW214_04130 [Pseudanabaenaceae cyanobacterium bins.39]|nr:hypothetical protein [Pseudanabaenaceae cyanobacterium bins.39]